MANCRKSWVSVTNTGFFMKNLLKLGCHFLAYSQELQCLIALSIKNNIIATRKANDENLVRDRFQLPTFIPSLQNVDSVLPPSPSP